MTDPEPGADLALALLAGFEMLVREAIEELDRAGHPGVTATLEFALRAVAEGADSASALGRRLGVSKQAAAKSLATLEQLGYVVREADPGDARRKLLTVTARGRQMHTIGAAALDRARARWATRVGADRLAALEADLRSVTGEAP